MLFAEVVATSDTVAATSSRTAKRDALAGLLERLETDEIEPVVGFLVGEPRQGRIGVGWRTLSDAQREPAPAPTLTVAEVDRAITDIAAVSGTGSSTHRRSLLGELLARATAPEATFLARLLGGELRQGALAGVMTDAVARAAHLPVTAVRRAVMLGGRLDTTAAVALTGGASALAEIGLRVGRPVQPMLASTAESVRGAVEAIGLASVEWKLDGIRVQVHRDGDSVRVWTRNLNEVTDRLPGVVAAVSSMPAERLVLDGEAIGFDATGRPRLFQDTVSRRGAGKDPAERLAAGSGLRDEAAVDQDLPPEAHLRPFFFDVMHVDGRDLIDAPLAERLDALDEVAAQWRIPGELTHDPAVAETVLGASLDAGHEGAMVKAAASPYEAGRRGKAWRKVKPVHTFDLVVLAAEWGHGRRHGWLSNLHLGARLDDGSTGGPEFVMVGKTFKGLTDELLAWQTERFLSLAEREDTGGDGEPGVVWVAPVQVVEVALDGVQRSTRYPGGVALRFARVVRYRHDKDASQSDTLGAVSSLLGR